MVELSENVLNGMIEDWFLLLPSLQQVNLENNSFTGIQISRPVKDGGNNLVALNIGFNKIQGYAPVNLAAYPMLSFLSMSHNSLRGTIPLEYGKIKSIKKLFLDGNFFVGKPPTGLLSAGGGVSGSLGDNCLEGCPTSSQLCKPAQKPISVCKRVYLGKSY